MPITDARLALLRAALLHEDGLLPRPDRLAGAALSRVGAALTTAGMADPVPVHSGQPRWREIDGVPTGLRITDTGRVAAGAEPTSTLEEMRSDEARPEYDRNVPTREPDDAAPAGSPAHRPPRPGSKSERLVAMLSATEGITIDALSASLSWQPHTVRAALTRLRQRGLAVTTSKDAEHPTTYRIAPASQTLSAPASGDEVG